MTVTSRAAGLFAAALLAVPDPASAQVVTPPRPDTVAVQIHYRIRSARDERVRQYRALEDHLKRLGFARTPGANDDLDVLDPAAEEMSGTVPSKGVLDILGNGRVLSVLFAPVGFKPDDPATLVPVRIGLASGLSAKDQRLLHAQAAAQLGRLGFAEAVGYDHRGFTVLRGQLPAASLPLLLHDLRRQPAGWFVPETPVDELPSPLRDVWPVRWTEVLPADAFTPLPPGDGAAAAAPKFTPELREVLADEANRGKPVRVEVVYDFAQGLPEVQALRSRLAGNYLGASVEGVLHNIVTVRFERAGDLLEFVTDPTVATIRLPRAAGETAGPVPDGLTPIPAADLLRASRAGDLHEKGQRGQGMTVAVVASGFPGWEALRGNGLPAATRLVDLTAELSPDLLPADADPARPGSGTAAARAAALGAPGANLVLIRVDPSAQFQLLTAARFLRGSEAYSEAMQSRSAAFGRTADALVLRRAAVLEEYTKATNNLSDDPAAEERRQKALAAFNELLADERKLSDALHRFSALQKSLAALGGPPTVLVNTLVWETGYPVDGFSTASRFIDTEYAADLGPNLHRFPNRRRPVRPLWVQAASDRLASVWAGPYLDQDQNGVMEFAPPATPVPAGNWTRELNFIGHLGADGKFAAAVPAGVKLRATVQWREAHNPDLHVGRDSVVPLTLRVLQQLDPAGETRASDDFNEVARTVGPPALVRKEPTYGVYEATVEFPVTAAGPYALRVEGVGGAALLPALRQEVELRPRIALEYAGAGVDQGRPVFRSFAPQNAGVGIPGDAVSALTIGVTDRPDGLIPLGLTGGGPGLALRPKPDLLTVGSIAVGDPASGPGVAAGYAAGVAASLIGSGASSPDFVTSVGLRCGGPFVIPDGWLQIVRPGFRAGNP